MENMERSIKVGVGCTTYKRPECLAKWKKQIAKHTKMDNVLIYIADDTQERKGVAFRKNECLRALRDCDYVFLFDDDCYPTKDNWMSYFIDNCRGEHLLHMSPKQHRRIGALPGGLDLFGDCGGVFMFLTRKHIQTVGAFNEEFGLWGFEHAEYSQRIYDLPNYYLELNKTSEYIFAEDYSGSMFKSSVSNKEKNSFFNANIRKFAQGYKKRYIRL